MNARENYSDFFKAIRNMRKEAYEGGGDRPFKRPAIFVGEDEEKYTAVRALDPETGALRWQYKLNSGNSLHTFRDGRQPGAAGILTTAGNILFTGGREGYFVVLNPATVLYFGRPIWVAR